MTTYVYTVEEQQEATGDAGYVHGVYATEAAAEAAAETLRAEWRAAELTVYEDDEDGQDFWDRSAVVTKVELEGEQSPPAHLWLGFCDEATDSALDQFTNQIGLSFRNEADGLDYRLRRIDHDDQGFLVFVLQHWQDNDADDADGEFIELTHDGVNQIRLALL